MILQLIRFKTGLTLEEVMQMVERRKPEFIKVPGLAQKYYVKDKQTGELAGIYLWETEEALRTYMQSDLAKSIPSAYKLQEPPRVEIFEVAFKLRS